MIGTRFGRLVVIREGAPSKCRSKRWVCRCDCGGESVSRASALRSGHATSCGCRRVENALASNTVHGKHKTPEYAIWRSMKFRCSNPNDTNYHNYGGRGISVCERWENFDNFMMDMGPRPRGGEIDRLDNDGPYSPENCAWVSRRQNCQNNRRAKRWFLFGKEYKSLTEASKALGIAVSTVQAWCDGRVTEAGTKIPPREGCYSEKVYPNTEEEK